MKTDLKNRTLPSSVYKMTNSCPVSVVLTHPDPVDRETSHSVFMRCLRLYS